MGTGLHSSGIHGLFQSSGGLFSSVTTVRARFGEPDFVTRIVQMGDLSRLGFGGPKRITPRGASSRRDAASVSGSGTELSEEVATDLALAEALERYCSCSYQPEQFFRASAVELGDDAIDLDTLPRCSETELAHPKCPLIAPDKSEPIRWVRAVRLHDGRVKFVPAVMTYLTAGYACTAERFWSSISTGCAIHSTYEDAVLNAVLEVVERDALSVLWLQQLALPRISVDYIPSRLAPYWSCLQASSKDLEFLFFDATTDIGIATVYGIQISHAERQSRTLVSCATSLDPEMALCKVIRDMAAIRTAFRNPRASPSALDDFRDIFDGAAFMARETSQSGFDFLLQSKARRSFREMVEKKPLGEGSLRVVLNQLEKRRMDVYAVDLTADEAVRCGLRAVRVIIPALQPFSFHYRARYLGHPRLYEAPRQMGYEVLPESRVNSWPQPFA